MRVEQVSGPLQTERMSSGSRKLLRDYIIKLEDCTFTIDAESETDFISLPSFGRWVIRWSKTDIAGVLHDALYHDALVTRREADWAWYVVARAGDDPKTRSNWLQAVICWTVLRLAGWVAHRSHARRRLRDDTRIVSKDKPFTVSMRHELLLVVGIPITAVALFLALGPLMAAVFTWLAGFLTSSESASRPAA